MFCICAFVFVNILRRMYVSPRRTSERLSFFEMVLRKPGHMLFCQGNRSGYFGHLDFGQSGIWYLRFFQLQWRNRYSATSKAIEYALDYANSLKTQEDNAELLALSREIKGQIHADYYLADLLTKGVAYHIGYLPADIRLRIEDLFKNGAIKTIFCTSTLL